jgi:hypothetical protein
MYHGPPPVAAYPPQHQGMYPAFGQGFPPYAPPPMHAPHAQPYTVMVKQEELKLPQWNDNWSKWHYGYSNVCRKFSIDPQTTETTPENAYFSQKLAVELRRVMPMELMTPFMGLNDRIFANHGFEMIKVLWDRLVPSNKLQAFDYVTALGAARFLPGDTPDFYKYRFTELQKQYFRACGEYIPSLMVLSAALCGVTDSKRYPTIDDDVRRGKIPKDLDELTELMNTLDQNASKVHRDPVSKTLPARESDGLTFWCQLTCLPSFRSSLSLMGNVQRKRAGESKPCTTMANQSLSKKSTRALTRM